VTAEKEWYSSFAVKKRAVFSFYGIDATTNVFVVITALISTIKVTS
jgi:hypothetical protein